MCRPKFCRGAGEELEKLAKGRKHSGSQFPGRHGTQTGGSPGCGVDASSLHADLRGSAGASVSSSPLGPLYTSAPLAQEREFPAQPRSVLPPGFS